METPPRPPSIATHQMPSVLNLDDSAIEQIKKLHEITVSSTNFHPGNYDDVDLNQRPSKEGVFNTIKGAIELISNQESYIDTIIRLQREAEDDAAKLREEKQGLERDKNALSEELRGAGYLNRQLQLEAREREAHDTVRQGVYENERNRLEALIQQLQQTVGAQAQLVRRLNARTHQLRVQLHNSAVEARRWVNRAVRAEAEVNLLITPHVRLRRQHYR